jgi:hypothetical protein
MKGTIFGFLLLLIPSGVEAAERPQVEQYLHSGKLALGEHALLRAWKRTRQTIKYGSG